MKLWYAVMRDSDDNDWGYGSHDKTEAINMTLEMRIKGYPDAYIAVISDEEDSICIEEIHDID